MTMEEQIVSPIAFTCPPDFTEFIDTEGLCIEDIDDADNELWIIQAAFNVDVMNLKNQHLLLNEPTVCHCTSDDGITETYSCNIAQILDREKSEMHLVLPERSSMNLHTVRKEIKGIVNISKNHDLSYPDIFDDSSVEEVVSSNLKKRCQSYGADNSFIGNSNGMGVKSSVEDANNTDDEFRSFSTKDGYLIQNAEQNEDAPGKTKKKHKKHKRDQGDLSDRSVKAAMLSPESNVSTCEEASIDDGIRKSKKKKKKKKKFAGDAVRQNGDSLLLSGNDSCLSQNDEHSERYPTKSKKKHRQDKEYLADRPVKIERLSPENSFSTCEEVSIDDGESGRKGKKKYATATVLQNDSELFPGVKNRHSRHDEDSLEDIHRKSKKKHRHGKGDKTVIQIKNEMPSDDERNLYSSEGVSAETVKRKEKKKKKKDL